jgi:hypothetical protein
MNTKDVNVVKYSNNYLTTSTLYTGFPLSIDLYQLHRSNNAQCEHNKDFYWISKATLMGFSLAFGMDNVLPNRCRVRCRAADLRTGEGLNCSVDFGRVQKKDLKSRLILHLHCAVFVEYSFQVFLRLLGCKLTLRKAF